MGQHDVDVTYGSPDPAGNPDLLPGFKPEAGSQRRDSLDEFIAI